MLLGLQATRAKTSSASPANVRTRGRLQARAAGDVLDDRYVLKEERVSEGAPQQQDGQLLALVVMTVIARPTAARANAMRNRRMYSPPLFQNRLPTKGYSGPSDLKRLRSRREGRRGPR